MSDLTSCNYCTLKRIRKDAKENGKIVVLKASGFMGGIDVFVLKRGEKLDRKEHFCAWLMEIPDRCVC
jgi:hypothetical protein